jgi:hypothetical protein
MPGRLGAAPLGTVRIRTGPSAEAALLIPEARALRDEYQHLIAEAEARHRPVPPPFPER